MKKTACRVVVYLSAVGLILSHGTTTAVANQTNMVPAAASGVVDVVLTDGILRGQVLDEQGLPKARMPVSVSSNDRVVQRTASDERGKFAVRLGQGGVYSVSAADNSRVIRAWTQAAAPPSARDAILLVSGQNVERGNLDEGAFGNPCVRTAIAIAAVGGIAAAIIVAADDDDGS